MESQEEIWEKIAEEWNNFRKKPLKEVKEFLENQTGDILDLGSGSGRHLMKIKNQKMHLLDFSKKMIKQAKQNILKKKIKAKSYIAQTTKLPFKNNFFNAAIFINVLHCIDSNQKREKSLKELYRVLKPKAQVMISVWSRNNKRIKNKPKDAMIPWTVNNKKYFRYYYIYDKQELEALLKKIGFKTIKSWEDNNIVFIVQKP